jgi:two-component system osmolarity sensor histidine kinase EnvZ
MKVIKLKEMKGLSIKQFLPRTLFGRSLLILITPVLLIQVIATFMFFDRHWSRMTTRLAYAVAGETAVVAKALSFDANPERVQRIVSYAKEHLSFRVEFAPDASLPADHTLKLRHIWKSLVAQKLVHELSLQLDKPFTLDMDPAEKWLHIAVQLDEGVLHITLPERRLFSSSGYIFLLWVFGTSLILLLIAILFMRNQIRPIRKLAAAAELFGKGRDAASFKPEGAKEVRQAGQAFMDMRRRIKRQIEQRTAMLAGVSHDLRTPLTRLKLQLSMLPETEETQAMKDDVLSMEKMIGGYLDFVRGDEQEEFEKIPIKEFLQKIIEGARHHDLIVHADSLTDRPVMIKPVAFERALSNIVSNAAKYAKNLWISCVVDPIYVTFMFDDDGPGIAEDQFEQVFKPFFRVDDSRNTETGGVGLGLSIAMDIVHGHGGQIWLDRSEKGGLKAVIRIPC